MDVTGLKNGCEIPPRHLPDDSLYKTAENNQYTSPAYLVFLFVQKYESKAIF